MFGRYEARHFLSPHGGIGLRFGEVPGKVPEENKRFRERNLRGERGKGGVDTVIQSRGEAVIMVFYWGHPLCRGWLDYGSRSGGRCGVFP
jgi:hypothetical protein